MRKFLLFTALSVILLLTCACIAQSPMPPADTEPPPEEVVVENPAPANEETEEQGLNFADINTKDIYGNEVDGSIFTDNELTMVNIWATYCGPCIVEMPYLGEMAAAMPQGTQLVGLAADALNSEYIELAINIAEETGADFTHLLPDEILYTYVYQAVVGVPTTIFIDSEGNVVGRQLIGAQPREVYEAELEARLQQIRDEEVQP